MSHYSACVRISALHTEMLHFSLYVCTYVSTHIPTVFPPSLLTFRFPPPPSSLPSSVQVPFQEWVAEATADVKRLFPLETDRERLEQARDKLLSVQRDAEERKSTVDSLCSLATQFAEKRLVCVYHTMRTTYIHRYRMHAHVCVRTYARTYTVCIEKLRLSATVGPDSWTKLCD